MSNLSNQLLALAHGTGVEASYTGATLTGSAVYSSQIPFNDNGQLEIHVLYTAGQVGATYKLNLIVDVSPDTIQTATGSSKWINIGTIANSSGTLTFTQSTLKVVSNAAAVSAQWNFSAQGKKLRVGISEEGTPSPFGTVLVWVFQKLNS